jgi:hypothetical protein
MIGNIMFSYDNVPNHQKRQVLSLMHGLVDLKHVRQEGFRVSNRTWKNAMNHAETKGPGAEVDPPKRPPSKSLSPETAKSIVDFITENSKHCPNRFVTVKRKQIPVMELEGI